MTSPSFLAPLDLFGLQWAASVEDLFKWMHQPLPSGVRCWQPGQRDDVTHLPEWLHWVRIWGLSVHPSAINSSVFKSPQHCQVSMCQCSCRLCVKLCSLSLLHYHWKTLTHFYLLILTKPPSPVLGSFHNFMQINKPWIISFLGAIYLNMSNWSICQSSVLSARRAL